MCVCEHTHLHIQTLAVDTILKSNELSEGMAATDNSQIKIANASTLCMRITVLGLQIVNSFAFPYLLASLMVTVCFRVAKIKSKGWEGISCICHFEGRLPSSFCLAFEMSSVLQIFLVSECRRPVLLTAPPKGFKKEM